MKRIIPFLIIIFTIVLSNNSVAQQALFVFGAVTNVDCNGNSTGEIDVTVTGGIPPYIYNWSNGATTEDLSGLEDGSYTVQVSDGSLSVINTPYPWGYTITSSNHTIIIPTGTVTINGVIPPTGSVIGVFYTDNGVLECGGYTIFYNTTTAITAWGDDYQTSDKVGFGAGEIITYQLFTNGLAYNMTATYDTVFPNQGNYVSNGLSGILALQNSGDSSVINTFTINEPNILFQSSNIISLNPPAVPFGSIDISPFGGTTPYSFIWSNSETTEDISNLSAGVYFLTITDANGCISESVYTVTNASTTLLFDYATTNVTCNGGTDGEATITNLQGVAPYSFLWSNGSTTQTISNLPGYIFYVTVVDAVGSSGNTGLVIYEPSAITTVPTIISSSQASASDGSISLAVSGGTSPYFFSWSIGFTTQNLNNMMAGTYYLTITDSNGCQMTDSYTIYSNNNSNLLITGTETNVLCNGDANGEIITNATGGTPPYSFQWSSGQTTQNISNLSAGTYTVDVFDSGTSQTGIPWPWSYTNTGNNATILIPAGSVTVNGVAPPLGSYIGVFYNNNGLMECGGYVEFLNTTIAITAWGDDASVPGQNGFAQGEDFSFQITMNGTTYLMDPVYNLTMPNQGQFTSNGMSGLLTLESISSTSATQTFTITEPDPIAVTSSITNINPAVSIYGSIDITVSGGTPPYSFMWSNGETTEDLLSVTIGQYIVTIHDANSCSLLDTFFITYTVLPDWNFTYGGNSHSIDIPNTAQLTVNGLSIENGDFIGVFYDSLGTQACAGYTIWDGTTTTLWAYGDNVSSTDPEGFAVNELMQWKFWDASANLEYSAIASYNAFYPNQEFWVINGESGLDSLQSASISGTITTTTKANLILGMVVIYEQVQGAYYAIDKGIVIDGEYSIDGIAPGEYLVYAIPAPGNEYGIPGYFGQSDNWDNAQTIVVSGYSDNVNITIDPVIPYTTGAGAISGNIYVGSDASYNPDVFGDEWFPGSTKDDEEPARNIPVILFDSQMNPVDFRLTNDLGSFEFIDLELGTYFVRVEKAGLQAEEVEIILTVENPTSGHNFSLESGYVSIHEMINESELKIYPNPVTDKLFIELEEIQTGDLIIRMYNITGQEIILSNENILSSGNIISIDMKAFTTGIYLLEISNNQNKLVYKINKM